MWFFSVRLQRYCCNECIFGTRISPGYWRSVIMAGSYVHITDIVDRHCSLCGSDRAVTWCVSSTIESCHVFWGICDISVECCKFFTPPVIVLYLSPGEVDLIPSWDPHWVTAGMGKGVWLKLHLRFNMSRFYMWGICLMADVVYSLNLHHAVIIITRMTLSRVHTSAKATHRAELNKSWVKHTQCITFSCPNRNHNPTLDLKQLDPDYHQNLVVSFTTRVPPFNWGSWKLVEYYLINPASKQTN